MKHLSYLSCLKIHFKIYLCDNTYFDLTLLIFLILNNISIIFIKKIIETNLAHCFNLNFINCYENKILKHVYFDYLWSILIIYNLKINVVNLSVTKLYNESIFDKLETEFNILCTIFENLRTVKLIAQNYVLNCVITDLMTLFKIEKKSSSLNI